MVTVDVLKDAFYEDSGVVFWKNRPLHHFNSARSMNIFNTKFANKSAGCIDSAGYVSIGMALNEKRIRLRSHVVVFALHTGSLPVIEIDHINGNRADNRIENLRSANRQQNMWNTSIPVTNKSGIKGVCWHKTGKKWRAQIQVSGKQVFLGLFNDIEDAATAYSHAAKKFFGEFVREQQ